MGGESTTRSCSAQNEGAGPVIKLGEVIMILDLHRQGLTVSVADRRLSRASRHQFLVSGELDRHIDGAPLGLPPLDRQALAYQVLHSAANLLFRVRAFRFGRATLLSARRHSGIALQHKFSCRFRRKALRIGGIFGWTEDQIKQLLDKGKS